jgi:hypothetical protein
MHLSTLLTTWKAKLIIDETIIEALAVTTARMVLSLTQGVYSQVWALEATTLIQVPALQTLARHEYSVSQYWERL